MVAFLDEVKLLFFGWNFEIVNGLAGWITIILKMKPYASMYGLFAALRQKEDSLEQTLGQLLD